MIRSSVVTFTLAFALAAPAAGPAEKKGGKAGDPAKGKAVFEQCSVCHNATTDEKKMGPSLKGLFKRTKMNNGKKPTDQTVLAKIEEGGNGMPSYKDMLSGEEKASVLAYLKTL